MALEYARLSSDGFSQNGVLGFDVGKMSENRLNAELGAEIRKYFSDSEYVFVTPGVAFDLVRSGNDPEIRLKGAKRKLEVGFDRQKNIYALLNAGARISLAQALSLNLNLGVKAGKKEQYYNASMGLRYDF